MDKKKIVCTVEQKVFVQNGEAIKYFDIVADIKGQSVHLAFKEKDKKLAEYLLATEN